jgi:hypothetical protein
MKFVISETDEVLVSHSGLALVLSLGQVAYRPRSGRRRWSEPLKWTPSLGLAAATWTTIGPLPPFRRRRLEARAWRRGRRPHR